MDLSSIPPVVVTSFLTTIATEGAKQPAKTLDLIWQNVFDPLNGYLTERLQKKQRERHIRAMQAYHQDISDEFQQIPEDQLKQDLDISLVGPALEASKYYIEEETIRKMFARLIAASFDKRKEGAVHHAFVDIIKGMEPLDARVLADLIDVFPLLNCVVYYPSKQLDTHIYVDIYLSSLFPEYRQDVSLSIGNLVRLGLVDVPTRNLGSVRVGSGIDQQYAEKFKHTTWYRQLQAELPDDAKTEIVPYTGYLTIMGKRFKEICLTV